MVVGQTGSYADIVVVGGGPAGYSAAIRAAQLGRSVTLVERDQLGGLCLNQACIPSKALLTAASTFARLREAKTMGIDAEPRLDFARMQAWKQGVVDRLSDGVTQLLRRYGVTVLQGTAHFVNDRRVAVERGESFDFLEFAGAIIATGSRPVALPDIPFDGKQVLSAEQALALTAVPERMAVVGDGYTGLEIATAYRRLGAEVTVIAAGGQLLPDMDVALGQAVGAGLKRIGGAVELNATPRAFDGAILSLQTAKGMKAVPAQVIVAAQARAPNTDDLSLEAARIHHAANASIIVDAQCRTNVNGIFAVGDVTDGPLVAQRAIAQGRVAAEALCGLPVAYEPAAMPLVYFTEPEVMSAGLTEAEARAAGLETVAARFPFGASGRAATLAESQGSLQVVAEAGTGRVLGIHAAGPRVSELAGEAAMAIELNATLDDLALIIHPHPTLSEAIPEAAWLALGAPLHIFRNP